MDESECSAMPFNKNITSISERRCRICVRREGANVIGKTASTRFVVRWAREEGAASCFHMLQTLQLTRSVSVQATGFGTRENTQRLRCSSRGFLAEPRNWPPEIWPCFSQGTYVENDHHPILLNRHISSA